MAELTAKEKKDGVIADYDDIAKEYAEEFFYDTSDDPYTQEFLDSLDGDKVLDAGCGNGEDVKFMLERGFEPIGIDLSKGMLQVAKERVPNGNFQVMDMANIEFPDNSFDGILSNCSLFHIPAEELPSVLKHFGRVLKPNGKLMLVLQEGNSEEMVEEPYRPGVFIYMRYFSLEEIQALLAQYDFDITNVAREESPSDGELGNAKLIIRATNQKEKNYQAPSTK